MAVRSNSSFKLGVDLVSHSLLTHQQCPSVLAASPHPHSTCAVSLSGANTSPHHLTGLQQHELRLACMAYDCRCSNVWAAASTSPISKAANHVVTDNSQHLEGLALYSKKPWTRHQSTFIPATTGEMLVRPMQFSKNSVLPSLTATGGLNTVHPPTHQLDPCTTQAINSAKATHAVLLAAWWHL